MSKAFGRPVDEVFTSLSSKPVAAASLGQVYKGRLRPEYGGVEVAVKVQRPDVLEQVCLDLYLMRQAAEAISALPEVITYCEVYWGFDPSPATAAAVLHVAWMLVWRHCMVLTCAGVISRRGTSKHLGSCG